MSAMGAAEQICVSDISDSWACPLGRDIRRWLKVREGISEGVLCVYSIEKERKKQIPLTKEEVQMIEAR